MDERLKNLLARLLCDIDQLNREVLRLDAPEDQNDRRQCFGLIEEIRSGLASGMHHLRTAEKRLYACNLRPPREKQEAMILPLMQE